MNTNKVIMSGSIAVLIILVGMWNTQCTKTENPPRPFAVFQFLPYDKYMQNGNVVTFAATHTTANQWFSSYNIKAANVVYNPYDIANLKSVAQNTPANSLISLDVEKWSFYDTSTPDNILQIVLNMKNQSPQAPVGLYGVVPVNTFGWKSTTVVTYDALNPRYQEVANAVDVLSPSLYSYQPDIRDWVKGAAYNIQAARNYHTGKKIIPYLSVFVRNGQQEREKTYEEMKRQLFVLDSLQADGCLVWNGYNAAHVLYPDQGWLLAMIEFAKSHP